MSVYLALWGGKDLSGIYASKRDAEAKWSTGFKGPDPLLTLVKKDVTMINEGIGEITFSDGSKLELTVRCVGSSWGGCSGETEIEYDYEAKNEH